MNFSRCSSALRCTAVTLILPVLAAVASDTTETKTLRPATPPAESMSLDFGGGPMSKLATYLKDSGDARLSLVLAEGLDPVIPAFSMRNVRVDAVVFALAQLLEAQGILVVPVGPNLAVVRKVENQSKPPAFQSFQLEELIGERSADDIVNAIQTGCLFASAEGKASTLRFKYHPGTKLLFVAGTRQEVEVAERVYQSLPRQPRLFPPPTDKK